MLQSEIFMCKPPAVFFDVRRSVARESQASAAAQQIVSGGNVGAFSSVTNVVTSMLRGVTDDSTSKLALTLTESGQFVSLYAAHIARSYAQYHKKSNTLISLQTKRVWLCKRQNYSSLGGEHISSIVEQPQLNAEFDRQKGGGLQQSDGSLLRCCYEEFVSIAKSSSSDVATCQKLCSTGVVMQWIEQQRESVAKLAAADDSDMQSPVLLDLSYRHSDASENAPILLLDDSIRLSGSSVTLSQERECDAARRTAATVMVLAIRVAAELALPVNMTAVIPLTRPRPSLDYDGGDCKLIVNLRYEPQSIYDLEAFGAVATVSLIFNAQFPIWRHYHLVRDASDGKLAPLWYLEPKQGITSVLHADYNDEDLQQLMTLGDYNIVPHLLWHSRRVDQPFRTAVRFERSPLPTRIC